MKKIGLAITIGTMIATIIYILIITLEDVRILQGARSIIEKQNRGDM